MRYTIIFLLLFSIGCKQLGKENIIAPNSGKYWDVIKDGNRVFNKPAYCYYFNSNGGCLYYYYRMEDGKIKRKLFDYGDVVYPNTWQLKSDTLEIQGFHYLIKNINKDSIILLSKKKPVDTLILGTSIYP
jgi:hypothetical protein